MGSAEPLRVTADPPVVFDLDRVLVAVAPVEHVADDYEGDDTRGTWMSGAPRVRILGNVIWQKAGPNVWVKDLPALALDPGSVARFQSVHGLFGVGFYGVDLSPGSVVSTGYTANLERLQHTAVTVRDALTSRRDLSDHDGRRALDWLAGHVEPLLRPRLVPAEDAIDLAHRVGLETALYARMWNTLVTGRGIFVCRGCGDAFASREGRTAGKRDRTVGVLYCSDRCATRERMRNYRARARMRQEAER